MYANVVVLTYQAPNIQTYTYKIPKEIEGKVKVGQIVSIPFGKRTPLGLIVHLQGEKPYTSEVSSNKIKSVNAIFFPTPILLPFQIELLKWMSFYYHAPMVNCLKTILPELPNAKRLMTNATPNFGISHSSLVVSQTIILVPSLNHLPETLAKYPTAKNYVVYHSELKTSEKFTVWLKSLSGQVDYIFGSRSAIFTPCPNLKKIIIYDEHDNAYKDERSPYYDTLTVAEKISILTGCKLEIIDSSPKITTYFSYQQTVKKHLRGESSLHLGGGGIDKKPKIKIISMLDEKRAGNKSPISDLLTQYLIYAQKNNKKVLLFLNKKSESGSLYCRACQQHQFHQKKPDICPNCKSPDIWFNSLNISSLANLVHKIVPETPITFITESVKKLNNTTINIATASVFYRLSRQKYDLVANIIADSILNIPDFTSPERTFAQIIDLKNLAQGMLVLQTYNPDHPVIQAAATGNWQQFFEQELRQRQALSYPPFGFLVKLTIRGKKEEKLESNAQKLFDELNLSTVNREPSTILLGPYRPIFEKPLRYNIILKVPIADYSLANREKALKNLEPLLAQVPRNWQITVEPASLN